MENMTLPEAITLPVTISGGTREVALPPRHARGAQFMIPADAYTPDQLAARKRCHLHRGSAGPLCLPCNVREAQERIARERAEALGRTMARAEGRER